MIVFITGTPGVGKTTVARHVSEKLGYKLVNLGEYAVARGLVKGFDERLQAYEVDVEAVRRSMERELDGDYVVECHVPYAVPPRLVKTAVVLRLNPLVLEKRLLKRGYPWEKVIENVQSEFLDVVLAETVAHFGEERVFEIDTTNKEIEKVVGEVLDAVLEGRGPRPGSVDWTRLLEENEHLLAKYFVR